MEHAQLVFRTGADKAKRHADKAKRVRNSCSCNWPGDMVARMRSLLPTWSTLLEFYVFIFLSNVSNYRVGNIAEEVKSHFRIRFPLVDK